MIKICTNCEEEFKTKRKDKLFCSGECRVSHLRNVTNDTQSVTDHSRNVTDNRNVTDPKATAKQEKRDWLIQQFRDEGKPSDEITKIMQAQENYYNSHSYYFIPARFQAA